MPIDADPNGAEVVEFFGMPGTGKTTVSLQVSAALSAKGRACVHGQTFDGSNLGGKARNAKRLGLIARELPSTIGQLPMLIAAFRVPQKSLKHRLKAVYNIWTMRSVLTYARKGGSDLILDQGPLQAVWSLFLTSPDTDIETWLSRLAPPADTAWHVVVLTANPDVLKQRLDQRAGQHSRLQQADGDDTDTWARGASLIDLITTAVGDLGHRRSVTVHQLPTDNSPPEALAKALLEKIDQ